MNFDWGDLAFGNKKAIKDLKAIFIAAPREISAARFKQLVKDYLPQGNIVLGIAKEPYVAGFEEQPQFRMLRPEAVRKIIDLVNKSASSHQISTLHYAQHELIYLLEKLNFKKVVLVRGSWPHVFHLSPAYYRLAKKGVPYEMVSPFTDEEEARAYAERTTPSNEEWAKDYVQKYYSEKGMLELAAKVAKLSYDYSFQTGVALGKKDATNPQKYKVLGAAYNYVVPFPTYAMHHGTSREDNLSPAHDLNHYDTVHAEVELILGAQREHIDLAETTAFINLMPCPACARMLSHTDIAEIVYSIDHSEGYAVKMLEAAGKKVRRIVL